VPPAKPPLVGLERKLGAVGLVHFDPRDMASRTLDGDLFENDLDGFVFLVGQNVLEPADDPSQRYEYSEQADVVVGHQSREQQRDTKSHDQGPGGGRGQMDLLGPEVHRLVLLVHVSALTFPRCRRR
jgi:hypothetical protein